MNRAIVIGCPGAGKSFFSRRLCGATGLPLYHLDLLWHKPDRTTRAQADFDQRLKELLARERWVIDGNYLRTLPLRLEACDTVFLLDYPVSVCLAGAQARIGRKRADFPWVETEFDVEFRQWIVDFSEKQLPQIYAMLKNYRARRKMVIFHSREQADQYCRALRAAPRFSENREERENAQKGPGDQRN